MSVGLKDHPISDIFPMMRASEFAELVHDIKENGLREPIVVHEKAILDGRNRYRACRKAGVEPSLETFAGDDPLKFVISKNLVRRHLKDSQRAFIAANLVSTVLGTNQFNRKGAISETEAAQLLNVSNQSVHRAVSIRKNAIPELKNAVENGAVSISAASIIAAMPVDKQRETVRRGKTVLVAEARRARHARGRHGRSEYSILWKCLDEICDALEQARIDVAHVAASRLVKELLRVAKSRRASR